MECRWESKRYEVCTSIFYCFWLMGRTWLCATEIWLWHLIWLSKILQVWQNYTCKVSASGLCTTVGRVTPVIYAQLVAAVNESYALEHYTPPLLSLQDCNFVRDTFKNITTSYCPPLSNYIKIVNAGLGMISVGVLLCLVLWILYANRPQREEVFVKLSLPIKGSMSYKNCFGNNSIKNDVPISNPPSGEV